MHWSLFKQAFFEHWDLSKHRRPNLIKGQIHIDWLLIDPMHIESDEQVWQFNLISHWKSYQPEKYRQKK